MKVLEQEYKIKAPIAKVWEALVEPKVIEKWGGGPAKMNEKVGFEFSLWGGDIFGKNTKVIKEKLLSQDWSGGKWEKPSQLEFDLSEKDNVTTVKLTQRGIPDDEFEDIADGWKTFYLGEIKRLLEK